MQMKRYLCDFSLKHTHCTLHSTLCAQRPDIYCAMRIRSIRFRLGFLCVDSDYCWDSVPLLADYCWDSVPLLADIVGTVCRYWQIIVGTVCRYWQIIVGTVDTACTANILVMYIKPPKRLS